MFDSRALGTPSVRSRTTVDVASANVQEPAGPSTGEVAVYLSKPATSTVTTYLTAIGSATGDVGNAMDPVTFKPGQTCQVATIPVTGSTATIPSGQAAGPATISGVGAGSGYTSTASVHVAK
jgi:hypothetical protein